MYYYIGKYIGSKHIIGVMVFWYIGSMLVQVLVN